MEEPNHSTRYPLQVAIVFPAAGTGSRMGGSAKQFRVLGDAPVLVQTLRAFTRLEEVSTLIVVVPDGDVKEVEGMLVTHGIKTEVVVGGANRQASVAKGIDAVKNSADIVLVHDAVRPFVSVHQIREVIAAIRDHGAAAVATPVSDTLRKAENDRFSETVDRRNVYRMLTPQGALTNVLVDAYRRAAEEGFVATDEVEILQRVGVSVRLVVGDERNIKLTQPSDWALAEALWSDWRKEDD